MSILDDIVSIEISNPFQTSRLSQEELEALQYKIVEEHILPVYEKFHDGAYESRWIIGRELFLFLKPYGKPVIGWIL